MKQVHPQPVSWCGCTLAILARPLGSQAFQAPCKPLTKRMAALLRVNRLPQAEHAALWPYAEDDRFEEGSSAVGVVDIVESCSENDFA